MPPHSDVHLFALAPKSSLFRLCQWPWSASLMITVGRRSVARRWLIPSIWKILGNYSALSPQVPSPEANSVGEEGLRGRGWRICRIVTILDLSHRRSTERHALPLFIH